MIAVILAGGLGSRIQELTNDIPKPMIKIGGKPILWHIMKIYYSYGVKDFIVCAGYKDYIIKEYFYNYTIHNSDVSFDIRKNKITYHNNKSEDWNVTIVNTGEKTMTGGRLKRVSDYISDENFCFTYGDAVCNVDIKNLIKFHENSNSIATLTAVQPSGRFGQLTLGENSKVESFIEKPSGDGGWINGGFFVLSKKIFEYIEGDHVSWEEDPLKQISKEGKLSYFKHNDFWQCMDTLRDWKNLENKWNDGTRPWKVW